MQLENNLQLALNDYTVEVLTVLKEGADVVSATISKFEGKVVNARLFNALSEAAKANDLPFYIYKDVDYKNELKGIELRARDYSKYFGNYSQNAIEWNVEIPLEMDGKRLVKAPTAAEIIERVDIKINRYTLDGNVLADKMDQLIALVEEMNAITTQLSYQERNVIKGKFSSKVEVVTRSLFV